ncbi:hypothetical protein CPB83DRAFT_858322 [Crepidotus variabilis]|uniref:Uncharacterized protein n=1 Tax=Crepidotus variabilis TaxID=179855 RepID=A0A9P6EC53_9AGAR|nr:hypothetical protein CPB83DRAFT_858322 [Crepidotus variabilis]
MRMRKLSITVRETSHASTIPLHHRGLKANGPNPFNPVTRFRDLFRGRKPNKVITAEKLLRSFVNLREVQLHCANEAEEQDFGTQRPLLLSSIQAYSSTLTSIGLAISPLSFFFSTFLPTLPTFPTLERLSLRLITMAYISGDPAKFELALKDVVAPFINRHSQTLCFIQVIADAFLEAYDLLTLFDNIDYIPHLKTLEIPFLLIRLPTSRSLHRLLRSHSTSLEDLILYVPFMTGESSLHAKSSFAAILTPLPHLKKLEIHAVPVHALRVADLSSTHFINYVSRFSGQLSSFALYTKFLVSDDWKRFSGMDWNCLTSLSLGLAIATPAVFDAFPNKFPLLWSLSLVVGAFQETFDNEGSIEKL